jgi:signal peptidase II
MAKYWPFLVAAAIIGLDRVTKAVIRRRVDTWEHFPVIPGFFSVVHTENPGAAFGMFSDSTSLLRPVLLIGLAFFVIGFIAYMLLRRHHAGEGAPRVLRAGLGLVLGGAAGNLFDRVTRGTVTDFLEFYFGNYTFPAFNVADSAITVGAGLLLLDMWFTRTRREGQHAPQTD